MKSHMSAAKPLGHRVSPCPKTPTGSRTGAPEQSRMVDRNYVFDVIQEARKSLGLGPLHLNVLKAHLSALPKGLLDPLGMNISWMKCSTICKRAGSISPRQRLRGETGLDKSGLVIRNISANGRRFAVRTDGEIEDAYGIDLGPLLRRLPEIEIMNAQMRILKEKKRNLKTRVSSALQSVVRSSSKASSAIIDQVTALQKKVRNALRRASLSMEILHDLLVSITDISDVVTADTAVIEEVVPDRNAPDDGQIVRHIESPKKESIKTYDENISMKQVWSRISHISDLFPEVPQTEHQVAGVILQYSGFVQISRDTALRAIRFMGYESTLVSLNYIAMRVDQIQSPSGYLISMIKKFQSGEIIAGGQINPRKCAPLQAALGAG